jgi:large subunit ribosomal protein L6
MKANNYTETLEMPQGITARFDGRSVTVKGKYGEVKRKLIEPGIVASISGNKITFVVKKFTKKEKTKMGTIIAHLKNMFNGAEKGHPYRLKVCSGHFPMNVSFTNNQLVVKNFIGEKVPRTLAISKEVKLKVEGEFISLEAADKELAGQTAAAIEHMTRRADYDRRVFQDGIYIIEKDGKPVTA